MCGENFTAVTFHYNVILGILWLLNTHECNSFLDSFLKLYTKYEGLTVFHMNMLGNKAEHDVC